MKRLFRQIVLVSFLFFAAFQVAADEKVTVFAAASLRDALDDVAGIYPGKIILSYGGSGQIARQVANGAPADIVILANATWMDWLQEGAFIDPDNRLNLLTNTLALVGPFGAEPFPAITSGDLLDRLSGGRMAIGQTSGVPAGIYGRQWLENAGFWLDVAPYLAETENVRTALALVARKEAPLGIVYQTDATAEPGVVILYDIPGDLHDPILYPMAIVSDNFTPHAVEVMNFFQSVQATEIYRAHGFKMARQIP